MAGGGELSDNERGVMNHALSSGRPLGPRFRNHFCAGSDHEDWPTLQGLCARGLMRVNLGPDPFLGGMTTFAVTEAGIEALDRPR